MKSFDDLKITKIGIKYKNYFKPEEIIMFKKIVYSSIGLTLSKDKNTAVQSLIFNYFKSFKGLIPTKLFLDEEKLFQVSKKKHLSSRTNLNIRELLAKVFANCTNPKTEVFIKLDNIGTEDIYTGMNIPLSPEAWNMVNQRARQLNISSQQVCLAIILSELKKPKYLRYCRQDVAEGIKYLSELSLFKFPDD